VFEIVLCTPLYFEVVGLDCFFLFQEFCAAVAANMVDVVAEHVVGDGDDASVHWDFCCSACQFAGL